MDVGLLSCWRIMPGMADLLNAICDPLGKYATLYLSVKDHAARLLNPTKMGCFPRWRQTSLKSSLVWFYLKASLEVHRKKTESTHLPTSSSRGGEGPLFFVQLGPRKPSF